MSKASAVVQLQEQTTSLGLSWLFVLVWCPLERTASCTSVLPGQAISISKV